MFEFERIYRQLRVNRRLVLEFFATFSRFEYALKRAGYRRSRTWHGRSWVEPDWRSFSAELERAGLFDAGLFEVDRIDELAQAVQYLQNHPPRTQTIVHEQLDWVDTEFAHNSVCGMIELVKTVRNNLFHGGKFPMGLVAEPGRDSRLLRSSLTILLELLKLCERAEENPRLRAVSQYFLR